MTNKKRKLVRCFVLLLFLLIIKDQPVLAGEIPQSTVRLYDTFEYEYKGNILEYSITNLANGSEYGTVGVNFYKSSSGSSSELYIPKTVTYLGKSYTVTHLNTLFHGSKNITSVHIPDTIKSIPYEAFKGNTSLTQVILPDSVTSIGNGAFKGCSDLKTIQLPKYLKEIRYDTFSGCTSLESVVIPEGLLEIYNQAFENCVKLQSLRLPESITDIDPLAFEGSSIVFLVDKGSYASYFCKGSGLPCTYISDVSETNIPLDEIVMKKKELILHAGKKDALSIVFYPYNTTKNRSVKWTSSNAKVATVDGNGMVTGVRPGLTTVTAKAGTVAAKCMVVVSPYSPKPIKAVPKGIDSIKVSWEPIQGVTDYAVYRATKETGTYARIKDVKTSYYLDSSLKRNTTYYYKVYGYNHLAKSYFSEIVSARTKIATPKVSAAPVSNSKIKIRWESVKGASGYNIYRSDTKNGTYKLLKSVTSPYFTNTSLKKGKAYYYNVKAYYNENSKKVYSRSSKTVRAVPKTPVTPKAVTFGTSKSDVYKILGQPVDKYAFNNYLELYYRKGKRYPDNTKTAVIYLKKTGNEYIVIGWDNLYSGIKVSDGDERNTGTFTLGSSWSEVAKAMKTPSSFEMQYGGAIDFAGYDNGIIFTDNAVEYPDNSTITFDQDMKVTGWENKGSLKIRYGSAKPAYNNITLGTSLTDVLKAQGTPDKLRGDTPDLPAYLTYSNTILVFNEYQKLVGWENRAKLNIIAGEKDPASIKVKVGYSREDVIKAMGTPDTLKVDPNDLKTLQYMVYGKTVYNFDDNERVSSIQKS